MDEQQHVALPKLYGAPAYARPAPVVAVIPSNGIIDAVVTTSIRAITPRPFDPDDLPIEAIQTEEEREIASTLPASAYAPGGAHHLDDRKGRGDGEPQLRPRPLSLRALAGRILGQADN